jgi:class 3 adenylate cyclase/tetratricopeptide (TPR) repeat protein
VRARLAVYDPVMGRTTSVRELVALNGDIVAYSRSLADDPVATSATMAEYREIVGSRVSAYGGRVASFVGDNFMALFEDPKDAVQAAIAITTDIEERTASAAPEARLRFRLGLDVGPIADVGSDYEGEALAVAARIQAKASPGGLSISGALYAALDEPALRFRATGEQQLKGIPEPVEIYEFVGLPTDADGRVSPGSLALETPSVAVLPIHADAVSDDVRSLGGIIRGDLLHRLSTIPELMVVDAAAASDAAPTAATRYMLETGIYEFGEDLRVFATLFDVTTMNVVKSLKWSVARSQALTLSDEIADEVARAIEVELVVGAPAGLYAELGDPEAIENVYLGWYHMRSETREGMDEAIRLFRQVAHDHPDQPYGHVLQAYALWVAASNGWVPDPVATIREAQALAIRGGSLGDPTGMAQALEAATLMSLGQVEDALDTIENLEIVRPTCDVTYALEGSLRRYLGQWEEAVDLLDVAMRLTGVNKPWYPTVKACSLFIGSRLDQAASVAERVLEHQPNNLEALAVLAASQHELGMERRAHATADEIRKRFPATDIATWLSQSPYQDDAIVSRWHHDLSAVGLIG